MLAKRLSAFITLLLIAVTGLALVQLSTVLIDIFSATDTHKKMAVTVSNIDTGKESHINRPARLKNIVDRHLFGKEKVAQAKAKAVAFAAPKSIKKTRLNLKLTGLVKGVPSVAVIVFKNKQGAYKPGEYIEKSQRLTISLDQVFRDHVIIVNNGVYERLELPKITQNQRAFIKPLSSIDKGNIAAQHTGLIKHQPLRLDLNAASVKAIIGGDLGQILLRDPLSLAKFVQLTPISHQKTNFISGYRLNYGTDHRLMAHSGLKDGDIVITVGSKSVSRLSLSMLYPMLQSQKNIALTLKREGSILTMDIKNSL